MQEIGATTVKVNIPAWLIINYNSIFLNRAGKRGNILKQYFWQKFTFEQTPVFLQLLLGIAG